MQRVALHRPEIIMVLLIHGRSIIVVNLRQCASRLSRSLRFMHSAQIKFVIKQLQYYRLGKPDAAILRVDLTSNILIDVVNGVTLEQLIHLPSWLCNIVLLSKACTVVDPGQPNDQESGSGLLEVQYMHRSAMLRSNFMDLNALSIFQNAIAASQSP